MNISLRQLRSLIAIAKQGNFTRAAQSMHISQPALTSQMRQFEEVLGVRLLDRNTRSVRLTPLGQQVVPIVERALGDIDTALAGVRLSHDSVGIIEIAALPSLCSDLVPQAIARFSRQFPGISVRLREVGAHRIPACVTNEDVELGFGLLERAVAQIVTSPLITDRLVVVCPSEHPLARKRTVVPRDLVGYPMISFDPQYSVRTLLDAALRSTTALTTPTYEVSFMSTAMGMVRAGLGITVVSSSSLGRAPMAGLKARPVSHPAFARQIVSMRKKGRTLSPAAESFLTAVYAVKDDAA